MTRRIVILFAVGACLLSSVLTASAAAAEPAKWKLSVTPNADYFVSGSEHPGVYKVEAENIGQAEATGPITLTDLLPEGLTAEAVNLYETELKGSDSGGEGYADLHEALCPTLTECEFPGPYSGFGFHGVKPHQRLIMLIRVAPPPSSQERQLLDTATVSGGTAPAVTASAVNAASPAPPFGLLHFGAALTDSSGTETYTQAGGRPYQLTTEYNFTTYSCAKLDQWVNSGTCPVGDPKNILGELPPGLLANPQAVPHCSLADYFAAQCEMIKDSVGEAAIRLFARTESGALFISPIVNLQPQGAYPGELGIVVAHLPVVLITSGLRTGSDYGVNATSLATPSDLTRIRLTFWGVPADEAHDGLRGKECQMIVETGKFAPIDQLETQCEGETGGFSNGPGGPAGVPPTPFLTMPTQCSGEPPALGGAYDTWQGPAEYVHASVRLAAVDGCSALSGAFAPRIEAAPTTDLVDAPSGLDFHLKLPQHEGPEEDATPAVREAIVRLPAGITVNPSSAGGLVGCSPSQIGLTTEPGQTPARFTPEPARCPDASKIGLAEVKTPLLHEPLGAIPAVPGRVGAVYLATPDQNPFGSLLAAYLVLEGQGIIVKLPGQIRMDPQTGQVTGSFLENPQTPFEEFHLEFFGGARGDLRTPAVCGEYETTAVLTPYSAPESGPPAKPTSSFELENGGAPCPRQASEEPNAPALRAGTESPQAGAFTPFSLRLARQDGSQEFEKIETTLPEGLTAKLAGVAECSEAQIAVATSREHEGGGAEEKASPACPASSEVGEVEVASGAGPTPLYVTGTAYLAGPYKGAPLSLAIITPAVAGPFDLGDVVVRTALYTAPYTAQIKAVSDPIPHILQGIPLDVRSITLKMARPNFTLNPTDCEEMGFSGSETSLLGSAAPLAQRFQVGGCQSLPFKPKLAISLKGGTRRHTFPSLTATVTMPPGQANIAKAQVTLPHNEQLEQGHITSQVCLQAQLATRTCPKASIYGYAKAETPLLDHPLEGPVYLGVGFGHKLPDLVAELNGQIRVLLHGKVDTGREDALRNTFEVVPDAPVSKFTLHMFGGKKGLIVNSENLCNKRAKHKVLATFTAQSGKAVELEPTVSNSCRGKGRKGRKGKGRKRG